MQNLLIIIIFLLFLLFFIIISFCLCSISSQHNVTVLVSSRLTGSVEVVGIQLSYTLTLQLNVFKSIVTQIANIILI